MAIRLTQAKLETYADQLQRAHGSIDKVILGLRGVTANPLGKHQTIANELSRDREALKSQLDTVQLLEKRLRANAKAPSVTVAAEVEEGLAAVAATLADTVDHIRALAGRVR